MYQEIRKQENKVTRIEIIYIHLLASDDNMMMAYIQKHELTNKCRCTSLSMSKKENPFVKMLMYIDKTMILFKAIKNWMKVGHTLIKSMEDNVTLK